MENRNDVSSFFFYMWNSWSKEECAEVFKADFWPHFWNKWEALSDKYGNGAVERFYAELSEDNRDLLVSRAIKLYNRNRKL